jgi:uncharacterized protein YcbX
MFDNQDISWREQMAKKAPTEVAATTWDKKLAELVELQKTATEALTAYNKKCEEYLGFADGRSLNIVQMAHLIRKVSND